MSDLKLDLTVEGYDVFGRTLDGLAAQVTELGLQALKAEMDDVLEAANELVPVETGELRDSGAVSDPIQVGDQVALTIGYGGDNGEVFYALDQHENLTYGHEEGKEAKFLETPLLEWTREGPRRVATEIQRGMYGP